MVGAGTRVGPRSRLWHDQSNPYETWVFALIDRSNKMRACRTAGRAVAIALLALVASAVGDRAVLAHADDYTWDSRPTVNQQTLQNTSESVATPSDYTWD